MSIKIMSDVWKHSNRKNGELLLMLALADFSNDQGESWPSLKNLAQKARLSKEQLCKVLKKLERTGEIRRERSTGGYNRRTRYFINLSPREHSEENTVKKDQCQNNSVLGDTKTVSSSSHAINRHRTVKSGKRKTSPAQGAEPRVKEFIDFYHAEYLKRFDDKYSFTAKDGALVKRLLRTYELDRLEELTLRFLDSTDPWVQNNGGFTIGVFASQINKLVSTRRSQANGGFVG